MGELKYMPVTLIGGPCAGVSATAHAWAPTLYVTKPLTRSGVEELKVSELESWKFPQCVYERTGKREFTYSYTLHYKPREGGQKEVEAGGEVKP